MFLETKSILFQFCFDYGMLLWGLRFEPLWLDGVHSYFLWVMADLTSVLALCRLPLGLFVVVVVCVYVILCLWVIVVICLYFIFG